MPGSRIAVHMHIAGDIKTICGHNRMEVMFSNGVKSIEHAFHATQGDNQHELCANCSYRARHLYDPSKELKNA